MVSLHTQAVGSPLVQVVILSLSLCLSTGLGAYVELDGAVCSCGALSLITHFPLALSVSLLLSWLLQAPPWCRSNSQQGTINFFPSSCLPLPSLEKLEPSSGGWAIT